MSNFSEAISLACGICGTCTAPKSFKSTKKAFLLFTLIIQHQVVRLTMKQTNRYKLDSKTLEYFLEPYRTKKGTTRSHENQENYKHQNLKSMI